MTFRPKALEISDANPFAHDQLGREPIASFLVDLLERQSGPFVMALDAPWGSGKTTLLKMLRSVLAKREIQSIYFNAWEADFSADPLVALFAALSSLPGAAGKTRKLKKIVSVVAKRATFAGVKLATIGSLDLEKDIESAVADLTEGSAKDMVDEFTKAKSQLEQLRATLKDVVPRLASDSNKLPLVFFIDEIDRCRPTYALELLERVKHVFETESLAFVLAVDKPQLEASIKAVYGSEFDAHEYLRRFFDLEFAVPPPANNRFTDSLVARFDLEDAFKKRSHPDLANDRSEFVNFLSDLSRALGLSLRAQERCFARLRLLLDQLNERQRLFPLLAALLIALRIKKSALYQTIATGEVGLKAFLEAFFDTSAGKRLIQSRAGQYVIGEYVMAIDDEAVREARIEEIRLASADGASEMLGLSAKHWAGALSVCEFILARPMSRPSLNYLAGKLDLVSLVH